MHNHSTYTQIHNKKFLLFLFQYMRMKVGTQKSIALKRNFKKLISTLLPIVKRRVSNQINKIKSRIVRKIQPDKRKNTLRSVSNRGIKSLKITLELKLLKWQLILLK